ncbi:MAG: FHA domain-containing protein [Myxococcales bacterium]|nr:FHA domain-containing protein [Myxococcales bacterium]
MLLSDLLQQWRKDRRAVEVRLTVPVLLFERQGAAAEQDWEKTGALMVGKPPESSDPQLFFVEKARHSGNAFLMGVTLGRVESNDVAIDDASVSRFHAWLQFDERQKAWLLCDAQSKNGTWMDGATVAQGARVPLHDGAIIKLGQASLRFLLPQTLLQLFKG